MKLRVTVMLIVLFCCVTALFPQGLAAPDSGRPYPVSLIQLIASPNDFNGQTIKAVGFLAPGLGFDRAVGLFVSETDARNFIFPNSIGLRVDESAVKDLMGRYVALSGTFHAPTPRSGYNGYIDRVLEVKAWRPENSSK